MTASSTELHSKPRIRPELTAMGRAGISVPARLALADGLLTDRSVLDFGCGRGGDVRRLLSAGFDAVGWDPHYRPDPPPRPAEVVLCSYVLNVISDPRERGATLVCAFELATRVLVVAVRGTHEARHVDGSNHADGTLTRRGTFHHLFSPEELRAWLQATLGFPAVPVQPGVAYVFRDTGDRAAYLSRRYGGEARPDTGGEVLQRLIRFLEDHGRPPTLEEQPQLCIEAKAAYGQLGRAVTLARREVDEGVLGRAAQSRREDLLVVLALERFHGGPRMKDLPADRIADLRAHYSDLREAVVDADEYLMGTGNLENIREAVRQSTVGKRTQGALYVHVDAARYLPPLLRLYAACGAMVAGQPPDTTVIKLHHDRAGVSFLTYPGFDRDAHPCIAESLTIDLPRLRGTWTDWTRQDNRPILHRKEEFLHPDDPRFERFRRLTAAEVRAGLYDDVDRIGREHAWQAVLAEHGVTIKGHRVVRA